MKGIDLFCASPASTTIIDQRPSSMVQRGHGGGGGRAIDRHNPHLRDGRRSGTVVASSGRESPSDHPPKSNSNTSNNITKKKKKKNRAGGAAADLKPNNDDISLPTSSRYLLGEGEVDTSTSAAFFDILTEFQPPTLPPKPSSSSSSLNYLVAPSSSTTTTTTTASASDDHQVVVLRVSLHCRGCEGKVRKHISKMKGVTSYNIDFFKKKVTVTGDVTPVGVLASISRVKNAQFWPTLSSSSPVKAM